MTIMVIWKSTQWTEHSAMNDWDILDICSLPSLPLERSHSPWCPQVTMTVVNPQHHLNFFSVSFVTSADLRPSFSHLLLWVITGSHETLVSHRQIQHVRMCEHTNTKIPSTHTRARTHAFTLIARREGDYPTVILRMNRNEISVVIYDKSNL